MKKNSLVILAILITFLLTGCSRKTTIEPLVHISELPDSDAGVVPDTFAMRFSRV